MTRYHARFLQAKTLTSRLASAIAILALYSTTAMAQHAMTHVVSSPETIQALSVLPAEQSVRKTLENLPQIRSGAINIDLAKSGKSRLQAGSYEWTARVGNNRRTDQDGNRYNEQELALERPVRWFGKAGKDLAIGEKGISLAQAAHADNWHEASRTLMKDWFDAIRETAALRRLREQLSLVEQLRSMTEKRVKAGDAAQLELLQADTETRRITVLLQQTQLREEQIHQVLQTNYPGLPLPAPDLLRLPAPPVATKTSAFWLDKIMEDNHELELAQAEADLYGLQAARVASDQMPDPTIALRAGRERNGQERLFGISISIPLPGAARQADTSSAHLKARMAAERVTQAQLKVRAAALRVVTDTVRSQAIWQTMQLMHQQSKTQAQKMMRAYQLGEATLGETLITRRLALDASLAAESAQIDALAALARLQLDAHLIWSVDDALME